MTNSENAALCAVCGMNPRLGALSRCKTCLKAAAEADRQRPMARTHGREARAFLNLKLGDGPLVAGDARDAGAREVVGEAMRRLAELKRGRGL